MTATQQSNGHTPTLYVGPPINIEALPQTVNLNLYQGDDFFLDIVVTNEDGSDYDLTNMTARAQVRATPAATEVMANFAATITDSTIHLHLVGSQAARLAPTASWDCEISGTETLTLVAGTVRTTQEVTRDIVRAARYRND
jgi:hypothetical protein